LRTPLTILLLILCLCWQSLAQAGSSVALASAAEREHAAMHFHGEAHHHDDHADGGVHQDLSPASVQHLLDDACTNAPALMASLSVLLPPLANGMLTITVAAGLPSAFVDGLERPPRQLA
jgi:hypothetical protein